MSSDMLHHTLCHCEDCRRHSGAPLVGWIGFPADGLTVETGSPKIYRSSEYGERHFCSGCGTGLFYYNESILPGLVDIQSATLDDAAAMPAQAHIQFADRLPWMADAHLLPAFERYPPEG